MPIYHPLNPVREQLRLEAVLVRMVAEAKLPSVLISGGPGIGKTHTAISALIDSGVLFRKIKGTPAGLLNELYALRDGGVALFDDSDGSLLGGGINHMNTMKEVMEQEPERWITNISVQSLKLAGGGGGKKMIGVLPPRFKIKCGVVVIMNRDIDEMPAKQREMILPLISRGLEPLKINSDPKWALNHVLSLVVEGSYGVLKDFKKEPLNAIEANDVIEWFAKNAARQRIISVRQIEALANLRKCQPVDWLALANSKLLHLDQASSADFLPADLNIGRPFSEARARAKLLGLEPDAPATALEPPVQVAAEATPAPNDKAQMAGQAPETPAPPVPAEPPPASATAHRFADGGKPPTMIGARDRQKSAEGKVQQAKLRAEAEASPELEEAKKSAPELEPAAPPAPKAKKRGRPPKIKKPEPRREQKAAQAIPPLALPAPAPPWSESAEAKAILARLHAEFPDFDDSHAPVKTDFIVGAGGVASPLITPAPQRPLRVP